jgi:hypothetical protein
MGLLRYLMVGRLDRSVPCIRPRAHRRGATLPTHPGDRWFVDETQVITTVHAFMQNIRRGHYEVGAEDEVNLRVLAAFELALPI